MSHIRLLAILWIFVQKAKAGKTMRALSDDPVGASVVGIYPEKIIMVSVKLVF